MNCKTNVAFVHEGTRGCVVHIKKGTPSESIPQASPTAQRHVLQSILFRKLYTQSKNTSTPGCNLSAPLFIVTKLVSLLQLWLLPSLYA